MSYVLWVLERPRSGVPTLAGALIGDFAVRAFASMETLVRLALMRRARRPDALLVDADGLPTTEGVMLTLRQIFAEAPLIIASDQAPEVPHDLWLRLFRPLDGLQISTAIDMALRQKNRCPANIVRYRDVQLECDNLVVRILPGEDKVVLPFKEAQLLRLFFENPGVCLTRLQIQSLLWEGVHVTSRTVDSHVSRLRRRLQGTTISIESVYGGGYLLR